MSKATIVKNKVSRARLGLIKEDSSVERHPSIKNLVNQMNNPEPIKPNNFLSINNINNNFGENLVNNNFNNKNDTKIGINIITCDHKISNEKDTFFVEANEKKQSQLLETRKNQLSIKKPIFYELNEEQKQFDKKITNMMEEGKDYQTIEDQFKGMLKK